MQPTAMNTVLFGDVRQTLRTLPPGVFHCCMTSPPYWNLRSYLKSDDPLKSQEIGSERTPAEFIETMVGVFREVRRVMRDDGVVWVNLGDSYAQDTKWGGTTGGKHAKGLHGTDGIGRNRTQTGLEGGQQCLIPHQVAMALQADGWILRSTVIWAKRSPMPESISGWRWRRCKVKTGRKPVDWSVTPKGWDVGEGAHDEVAGGNYRQIENRERTVAVYGDCPGCDKCRENGGLVLRRGKWRPTTGHEYVFMFSKSDRYFCDGDAVQEIAIGGAPGNKTHKGNDAYQNGDRHHRRAAGLTQMVAAETRNPRSVWSLSSEPYKAAHFATFPTELARRCIAASVSSHGCCAECGAPYAPVVHSERVPTRPGIDNQIDESGMANRDPERHVARSTITGYRASCSCAASVEPCRVLDPFGGSGTVGQVAHHLGCDYVLCELNREYLPLIEERIKTTPRWKLKANGKPRAKPAVGERMLFT